MDISRFTERARTIRQSAQGVATEQSHQFITATHLALSLLDDETGLVPRLLSIAGVEAEPARARLVVDLSNLPKVSGGGAEQLFLKYIPTVTIECRQSFP